jgi:hypothetical protein
MAISFTEGRHPCEFILNEEEGHISRDNVTIAESQTIEPGEIIVIGAGGYTAYAAGGLAPTPTTGIGIALYSAVTAAGETTQIAALVRLAEVNGNKLAWPAGITATQITAAAALLEANMVIVRGHPAVA